MNYCKRCVYPENARPALFIDEEGVCSGCRSFEARTIFREKINWQERKDKLGELLNYYKDMQRRKNNPYDCIIPVSGGKDSHFQVYIVKEIFGLNPLLVSYNHTFNTPLGIRNLTNIIEYFDCNLIRFTTAPGSAKRLAKYMLKRVGDVTWHYHAGIMTFPIKAAVQYDIPLLIWGEEGFSELVGMYNLDDYVEFTKKKRQEHSMRGIEPEDLINDELSNLTSYDLAPFFYPKDEEIERVGVRGIYLSNYISWDGRAQAEFAIDKMGFETAQKRERTFNIYAKNDDIHANGLHDYLKYLKFGYGRATDDASNEIRHGRMSREDGIEMVAKYDHVRPSDTDIFLASSGMTETELHECLEHMRDPSIWYKDSKGKWHVNDSVLNHKFDDGVDAVRIPLSADRKPFIRTDPKHDARYQSDDKQSQYVLL